MMRLRGAPALNRLRMLLCLVLATALCPQAIAPAAAYEEPRAFVCGVNAAMQLANCEPEPAIDPHKPHNKVLVIFVQYVNEIQHVSHCWDGWPVDNVPDWADSLIVASTDPADFTPGSLNHYFYTMSGGAHFIYGDYHDTIVVLDYWLQWYRDNATVAELCQEIIDKVDPTVDFADYDVDPQDGVVDMVCLLLRTDIPWGWQGGTWLGSETLTTDDFQGPTPITLNGCYPGSGTIQFSPNLIGTVAVMAHEYSHQIFVPEALVPTCRYAFPSDTWHLNYLSSYGLMDGDGQGTAMSAFERVHLGWVEPVLIENTTYGVSIPDAISTGTVLKVEIDPAQPDEYFLIENRQRVSFYELEHGDGVGALECCNHELESTGLMIYHVDVRDYPGGYPRPAHKTVDIEAADGMFDPDSGLPDPISGRDDLDGRDGPACAPDTLGTDAFTPGVATSFGPLSNPNTNGYAYDEPFGPWSQTLASGIRIQNIRYDPADPTGTTMLADFVIDRPRGAGD